MTSRNGIAVRDGLQAEFGGMFIEPGGVGYDEARRLHNGMIEAGNGRNREGSQ